MAKYIINVPDEIIEFMDGKFDVLIEPEVKVGECRHYKVRLDDTEITPYTEQDRKAVEDEVWDFILELVARHRYEVDDCFGTDSMCEIMSSIPYSEAKAQYGEWKAEKAKKDEIRIGDEVIYHGNKYVVGYVGADEVYHIVSRNWMRAVVQGDYQIFKTGRHFPEVAELKKKMGGGMNHEKEDISDYDY